MRRVTIVELKQWQSLRGVSMTRIAELYGYSHSTVLYHMQPKWLKEKRKAQWRQKQKARYERRPPYMTKKGRHENQRLFARALMQYALKRGIKRKTDLAEHLGVNRSNLNAWLKHAMPLQVSLDNIAAVTGMPMFAKMRGAWPTMDAYRELGMEPQAMAYTWYQPSPEEMQ